MKIIGVWSHKDGDHLAISERPWFRNLVEIVAGSCYTPHWGWDYIIWNAVIGWAHGKDRLLFQTPVGHSCEVSAQIWGDDAGGCWHQDEDENVVDVVTLTENEWQASVQRGLDHLGLTYEQLAEQAANNDFTSHEARKLWWVIEEGESNEEATTG